MIPRRWLVALALACGLVAGGIYEVALQREDLVVAARDLDVPRPLAADDLEIRTVSAGLAPEGAARRIDEVVGLVPRAPILRGQLVLTRSVTDELAAFSSGMTIPSGFRAVAIPVTAVNAVGGAVVAGARVDVLAVPAPGRAPAGRTAELLASSVVVLDVRGESGAAFVARDQKSAPGIADRVASVVIAIPALDEVRFADRVATSTFVLALASAR